MISPADFTVSLLGHDGDIKHRQRNRGGAPTAASGRATKDVSGTLYDLRDDGTLQEISTLVSAGDPDRLVVWLEAILASQDKVPPAPREIEQRLGSGSPGHLLTATARSPTRCRPSSRSPPVTRVDPGSSGSNQAPRVTRPTAPAVPERPRTPLPAAVQPYDTALAASQGGFYLDGQTARPLVDGIAVKVLSSVFRISSSVMPNVLNTGAASMVFHRDGTVAIGQWARDVGSGPSVTGVRQNLKRLVDAGAAAPDVDQNNSPTWGYTLGGKDVTWRSVVGITRTGALLYVDGAAMSARTLAEVLIRAGAVRAMELDINPQ